jgi:tRNA modification GTPase
MTSQALVDTDTIAAIATPSGIGGVGIVRISGPRARLICETLTTGCPEPRYARFGAFLDPEGVVIDHGLTLYFPSPASFTGEDVVELQGHGGMVVMDMLLDAVLKAGARLARPGEFSERAFLNGRMDLVQAEAIADLIESSTRNAARLAMRSLEGAFSRRIAESASALLGIRTFVEAAIDFPDEEIDFLSHSDIADQLENVRAKMALTLTECQRGAMLRQGLNVVLCGAPNAGKSSLLNALARKQRAIVSATAGTTRDTVDERVSIGGAILNLVDTAGLREVSDDVEREGIHRAREALSRADLALVICDERDSDDRRLNDLSAFLPADVPYLTVHNKIDLSGAAPGSHSFNDEVWVSAKTGAGIDVLERLLLERAAPHGESDTLFLARRRHIDAIERSLNEIDAAAVEFAQGHPELMAESLRLAHRALGEITGEVTSDDLLGQIFSSFCIGK